jgi:hypothetical protein
MSNISGRGTIPKDIPAHELPSANSIGNLEPVAFFNDAMPTE